MGRLARCTQYGPHEAQGGLAKLFQAVKRARSGPRGLRIDDVMAFRVQKHGMRPSEAIAFGMVVGGRPIIEQAGVMGGISAGEAEPGTHASIREARAFFDRVVRPRLVGLNVGRPDDISTILETIDAEQQGESVRPLFSHVGSEISTGVSMMTSIALAERLGVPLEVVLNYRFNEVALTEGLAESVRPITIPVDYSVVWEGGKHGAAQSLQQLLDQGIIRDGSRFPDRFKDKALIASGDKSIQLAAVPPQEVQIALFADSWEKAREVGITLTKKYEALLKENGINTLTGAESGFTTKQVKTTDGRLITLELVLDILNLAVESLGDDAKLVRYALDIAASEMYIPEIEMYYIGPASAGNADGLVDHVGFAAYKRQLTERYPRFFSIEDWADEGQQLHWESAREMLGTHLIMGDDNIVSNAALIRRFQGEINACLIKPNQSAEERAQMLAVATALSLGMVNVYSHRGTRPELETYTAKAAMATGSLGGKWTLWGVGRGGLVAAMNQADALFNNSVYGSSVRVPYQGALVLDPTGPYADAGWAQRIRAGV